MTLSLLLEAVGFTLVHFVWQGAVVAGLYKAATVLMPKLKPQSQYLLGLAALLAMAGAGVATFVFECVRLSRPVAPAAPDISVVFAPSSFDMTILLPWLDAAWLGGVAGLSARMIFGLRRIYRLSAGSQPVPDAIARRFAEAVARLGLANRVHIRLHPLIDGPFVVGIVRSVVYLPLSAISSLSPDQLDAVIAHELEHIRRADYAWNLLQAAIETLFFYHPAVWWIGARIREQRELCCDDAAVLACRDPLVYATALFSLAQQRRATPPLVMALDNGGTGPSLVMRVGRILGEAPAAPAARRIDPGVVAPPVLTALLFSLLISTTQVGGHDVTVTAPPVAANPAPIARPARLALQAVKVDDTKPLKPVRHLPAHAVPPAPSAISGIVPASTDTEDLDFQVVAKEMSPSKITYFFSGKPKAASLWRLFTQDHIYDRLGGTMVDGRRSFGIVVPVAADDVDAPAAQPGSRAAAGRYKLVVTNNPDEGLPNFRIVAENAGAFTIIVKATAVKHPASPPATS